jgi:hypothetical protein
VGGDHVIDAGARVVLARRLLLQRDADERRAEAHRAAVEDATIPFDVSHPPLMRATLLAAGPGLNVLVLSWDQLVVDAWSAATILRDLVEVADRTARGLPVDRPEPGRYLASRLALARWLESAGGRAAVASHRAGQGPERRLATPAVPDTSDPDLLGRCDRPLADGVAEAIQRQAQALRVPVFSAMLAGFALAAGAWAGDDGPTVRSTFAARETPDEEAAVGWLSNEVLLPLAGTASTVEGRLREIARTVFSRLSTQRVPQHLEPDDPPEPGLSVSIVYLPEALSAGPEADPRIGDVVVRQLGVSICPTGADLELYVAERPRVLGATRRPLLLLGGIGQRARVGQAQLEEAVARWAAAAEHLAALDWREAGWAEALTAVGAAAPVRP